MKEFRIVNIGYGAWRVDRRRSILFGLIKRWDIGTSELCQRTIFWTMIDAKKAIINRYPKGRLVIYKGINQILFYKRDK